MVIVLIPPAIVLAAMVMVTIPFYMYSSLREGEIEVPEACPVCQSHRRTIVTLQTKLGQWRRYRCVGCTMFLDSM